MIRVIGLTKPGLELAVRIASSLAEEGREAVFSGPAGKFGPDLSGHRLARPYPGKLAESVARWWADSTGLVFVASAGLVTRTIAACLTAKDSDPAVVVVDHQGRFAVSLLSGHVGGANRLAAQVARIIGGQPVITTATDNLGLPGWDNLARELDLVIENKGLLPSLTGAWIDGERLALVDPAGYLEQIPPRVDLFDNMGDVPFQFKYRVAIGDRTSPEDTQTLLLRPGSLSVGIGAHHDATLNEIQAAILETLSQSNLSPLSMVRLATIDRRRDNPQIASTAKELNVPLVWFTAAELARIKTPNPSPVVHGRVQTPSVAEAASLCKWVDAQLIVEKTKWSKVTVAVARIR